MVPASCCSRNVCDWCPVESGLQHRHLSRSAKTESLYAWIKRYLDWSLLAAEAHDRTLVHLVAVSRATEAVTSSALQSSVTARNHAAIASALHSSLAEQHYLQDTPILPANGLLTKRQSRSPWVTTPCFCDCARLCDGSRVQSFLGSSISPELRDLLG